MRHVELESLIPAAQAEEVLHAVRRFEKYPDLAPHVNATTVHSAYPEPKPSSSWELHFRSGLLRWTEDDTVLPEAGEIRFEQSDGDFDSFTGVWSVKQKGEDVVVRFDADFDFGIPSLEGILDPIAERVIKETVAWALTGLYPAVRIQGGIELNTPATVGA
ncbi:MULTISPECIES: SRPBCC family protein [unclassified Streptomyces]|uniref:type II toxin-antitoxin system RatA family toxin n=1 Tax=unclassified Streptomyces TaxID=2593676 RepID=UPI000DB91B71|nr:MULTISPECIES: SRPBCC family protein [Streptomyces]MYU05087.1 cyclase [Streptomyces sp. SID8366]MYU62036.1 cyclase [Streptomyces sp. SID69]RAJ65961.1 ribosome-associated toxin RatA of RatAB toxin-antitoxin module [Streptomyces sp. PsTaAH-130]TXJ74547.1 cyclase [Streptomyces lavendulae]